MDNDDLQTSRDRFSQQPTTGSSQVEGPITSKYLNKLLATTYSTDESSLTPLIAFQKLLDNDRIKPTPYELIRLHARCWTSLSDNIKSGRSRESDHVVDQISQRVKQSYSSLVDLLPTNRDAAPALVDGVSRKTLSHQRLSKFIRNFRIPGAGSQQRRIVAVAVPNGSLLGLLSFAVATRYTLAPINVTGGPEQFRSDVLSSGAKSVLVLPSYISQLGLDLGWTAEHGIDIHVVHPSEDMTCTITSSSYIKSQDTTLLKPNGPDDICILLFTSGTTGTKKLVPVTIHSVVSAVAFIGDSWRLSEKDVCLNMMPLNHIGGLLRNLFSPILLGGSTICCTAFDPNEFWDLVVECNPTWYYASPSMHSVILDEAPGAESLEKSRIRMVCNAAGGLLPSLATKLRDTFHCPVLPSYGMTECMPISTPPFDWGVEKTGTSGISIGPELAILDGAGKRESIGKIGNICVRGNPTFPGYLVNGKIDRSAFDSNGWFNTGDLGFMDRDGYLFITGRSKEVINRGGEIISPFEVEEAILTASRTQGSPIYGRVSESLAFSAPHDTLQETVGIVLVTPPGQARVDIRQLNEALKQSLHSTKWPVVIVYMQDVPRRSGKVCRVQLGERFGFDAIRDDSQLSQRHFQATCPPANTEVSVRIEKTPCLMDIQETIDTISSCCDDQVDALAKINTLTGFADVVLAPRSQMFAIEKLDITQLRLELSRTLHGYLIPGKMIKSTLPFQRDMFGSIDSSCLDSIFLPKIVINGVNAGSKESKVRSIYSELLSVPEEDIFADSDFFDLGGDSLRAGRLLSTLRKEFNVRIRIDELFLSSKVSDICQILDKNDAIPRSETPDTWNATQPGCTITHSSTNPWTLLLQLVPLTIIVPLRKAFVWFVFLETWAMTLKYIRPAETHGNMAYLLISMAVARTAQGTVMPFVAFLAKWIIIGRYKEGVYPMWSSYHNRWWLVSKIIDVCGLGIFSHWNWSRVIYYRLLGAKIGKNVIIEPNTSLGEYDLLEIGDNAELDRCICRAFAVEHNTSMYLGKIRVGKNAGAGLKSVIAPGTEIPDDVCIGMNSSSWECKNADGSNFDRLQSRIPKPHWLIHTLVILPIMGVFKAVSLLPWLAGLTGLVVANPPEGADMTLFLTGWFANPTRVAFHFLARILHLIFAPMVFLGLTILLKKLVDRVCGRMEPSAARSRSHFDRFRTALWSELIPNGSLNEISGLFGTHYEMTSKIVRALGGRVGKNVYWPGNGPSIQNFDLLEVGDDVVFGSWANIITSDGVGSDYVRIGDGSMVADRVVMLPGNELGQQAVLGSGTLTLRNDKYAPDTTWIGSMKGGPIRLNLPATSGTSSPTRAPSPNQNKPKPKPKKKKRSHVRTGSLINDIADLEKLAMSYDDVVHRYSVNLDRPRPSVDLDFVTDETPLQPVSTSTTPFGRAFYEKQAPYKVWSLTTVTAYCVLINIFVAVYWNSPTVLGLQLLSKMAHRSSYSSYFAPSHYRPFLIMTVLFVSFFILNIILSSIALITVISAKWILLGRRQPGTYDWDQSDYCQRWKLLLTIEKIRRKHLGGDDIMSLLTGTWYCSAYFRALGADIGKDTALYAGGKMSFPLTEPDLVKLGNRVAVDDASLVAHINSRGNFKLNTLVVGDRCVLRTGSRLLSGASMRDDSCLLEHTLVLGGDETDAGATCQGWPADDFRAERVTFTHTDTEIEEEKDMAEEMSDVTSVDNRTWRSLDLGKWLGGDTYLGRYQRIASTSSNSSVMA
jgi:acyl-CoA synthetase (AMP-forming)/AMP-acid ligase II/acetyltransferase-like isoleucine patch superfamily enzyme/acyl carrier protein